MNENIEKNDNVEHNVNIQDIQDIQNNKNSVNIEKKTVVDYEYFFGLTVINNIKIHHSKAGKYNDIYGKLGKELLQVIKNCKTDQEKKVLQQTLFVLTGKNVNELIYSTTERITVKNILNINKSKK